MEQIEQLVPRHRQPVVRLALEGVRDPDEHGKELKPQPLQTARWREQPHTTEELVESDAFLGRAHDQVHQLDELDLAHGPNDGLKQLQQLLLAEVQLVVELVAARLRDALAEGRLDAAVALLHLAPDVLQDYRRSGEPHHPHHLRARHVPAAVDVGEAEDLRRLGLRHPEPHRALLLEGLRAREPRLLDLLERGIQASPLRRQLLSGLGHHQARRYGGQACRQLAQRDPVCAVVGVADQIEDGLVLPVLDDVRAPQRLTELRQRQGYACGVLAAAVHDGDGVDHPVEA
mmetsp:Transcript_149312/g.479470  ORF Transcript_149312/g.479470 Transcript_149312/m.479470 type:complete len:288 (+) Transcript_149312:445-1308(+)